MTKTEIDKMLTSHKKWLNKEANGGRAYLCNADLHDADLCYADLHFADLCGADLRDANLCGADLRFANLREADLCHAKLCEADLRDANLCGTDLHHADLRFADLCGADLREANLRHADLRHAVLRNTVLHNADLHGADLDYSSWPLGCGSLDVKVDKRIAAQLLYHALHAMMSCSDEPDVAAVLSNEACLHLANQFHRVGECGEVGQQKKEAKNDDKGNN